SKEGHAVLEGENAALLHAFLHQYMGIWKMIDNLARGEPIFVWDSVGVGKTLQAIGGIVMYKWVCLKHLKSGALRSDAEAFFRMPDRAKKTYDTELVTKLTLFSEQRVYGLVVFDEVHSVRTAGIAQSSCAELRRISRQAIALTATPIVTSPMVSPLSPTS
ncbi:hypothetical protein BC628DRAFT_1333653, partial [Trametes gibbosa]